jgi:hypothetical protein
LKFPKQQSKAKAEMNEAAPSKRKLDIGLVAIAINIVTVSVYLYQAHIMQKQQHTAVLPYVEWLYSNANDQFLISVENKGIGPAFVKEVTLKLDDEEMGSNSELFKKLLGTSGFKFSNSTVARRVISPGEKIEMVHVYDSIQAHAISSLLQGNNSTHKLELNICYCSVYNDCWTTDGNTSIESSCN